MPTTSNPLRRHPLLNRLVAARELAGHSQGDLGDILGAGFGRASISKIERGITELQPTTLERWAAACGVHMDFFWMDFAEPTKPVPPLPPATSLSEAVDALAKRIAAAKRAA